MVSNDAGEGDRVPAPSHRVCLGEIEAEAHCDEMVFEGHVWVSTRLEVLGVALLRLTAFALTGRSTRGQFQLVDRYQSMQLRMRRS